MDNDYKTQILATGMFKRKSGNRYVCQCPFCNDNHGHMYVMFDMIVDTPLLYYCFKCMEKGIVNKSFLEYLSIDNVKLPKKSTHRKNVRYNNNEKEYVVTVTENDESIQSVSSYIESRIGHYPSYEELLSFQFIGNPYEYIMGNCVSNTDPEYVRKTTKHRYWFRLTNGMLIGRYHNDSISRRWSMYTGIRTDDVSKGLYIIKTPFDVTSTINVYIAEGIMDVIGLYYNYDKNNNVYIAVRGKDYESGIRHIISNGIFGQSVNVKIFKDSNVGYININKDLYSLFKSIDIYQNTVGKDYGVLPEFMSVSKVYK